MKARSVRRVERDVNGADGLFRRAAAGARDARRRKPDRRAESLARAERHLARGLLRDRPVAFERGRRDAHEIGLRGVRVGDGGAEEVLRRARDFRDALGELASRARLGERERLAPGAEEVARDPFERVVVTAEDLARQRLVKIALDAVEDARRLLERPARRELELHLAGRGENRERALRDRRRRRA